MFNYFGGKSKLARHYPVPRHRLVVEPFSGSAQYALYHADDHDVWINDLNPLIYGIWKWLQQATRRDVEQLPELDRGQDVRNFRNLSDVERALVGFGLGKAPPRPLNRMSGGWALEAGTSRRLKLQLLAHLEVIRDWKITCMDYFDMPDVDATWFVDAPYQVKGVAYPFNEIDYGELAAWCQSRRGQVIVCEEYGADWLPFIPFREVKTQRRRMVEAIWTRG